MPPVNVRVRDNRPFGRKPMVGVHVLKSLEAYRCQPLAAEGEDANVDIPSTFHELKHAVPLRIISTGFLGCSGFIFMPAAFR